jgi:hypothetical protein
MLVDSVDELDECSPPALAMSPRGHHVVSSTSAAATTTRRAARRESATESARDAGDRRSVAASHVVFVSSALVYGAAANNPVPLTEEATLRPDVEFVFARQLASAEELVEQWRCRSPGERRACFVRRWRWRPAGDSRLASALVYGFGTPSRPSGPAVAVPAPRRSRRGGRRRGRSAPRRGLQRRPRRLGGGRAGPGAVRRTAAPAAARTVQRVGRGPAMAVLRGPIPPGLLPYTLEPWVISNGRLRAAGWVADRHQRADLRREHRCPVVDDGLAEASTGTRTRRGCVALRWSPGLPRARDRRRLSRRRG